MEGRGGGEREEITVNPGGGVIFSFLGVLTLPPGSVCFPKHIVSAR